MPPGRRLSAEERALWARVAATVTPMEGKSAENADMPAQTSPAPVKRRPIARALPQPRPARLNEPAPPETLDGGWDRRLRKGVVSPDRTIDLHGHTLATAASALEHALARAVADDIRVLLVITGKPPKPDTKGRGLIRANIGTWLGSSGYRDRIAAVRNAHPRHGGTGALYVILRRKRGE
jgi:DNA-nicking Smr family endonuclease